MRRADRLFQIIQLLRRSRITTAASLAENLEVSERTIYRDIRDLTLSDVPIRGEAGVGYYLPSGFDLPAMMFKPEEIEALVLGARIVQTWADSNLAAAAASALGKVESALPDRLKDRVANTTLFAPNVHQQEQVKNNLAIMRGAIQNRQRIHCAYVREDETPSSRTIQPLGLFFWGAKWSLAGWCELRDAFRNFRLDRMQQLQLLEDRFEDVPGRTLDDFFESMGVAAAKADTPASKPPDKSSDKATQRDAGGSGAPVKTKQPRGAKPFRGAKHPRKGHPGPQLTIRKANVESA